MRDFRKLQILEDGFNQFAKTHSFAAKFPAKQKI
jgi:hypothetical protein